MGFQFENLVLNNRKFIWNELRIYPEEIINDNPYFQNQQTRRKACQIDYMIQLKTNVLLACEIKFYKSEIKRDIIEETKSKLENLYLPHLLTNGFRPTYCQDDTMLLHHALYPEMLKGLGFLGSIYSDEISWKQMRTKGNNLNLKRDE